jgi:hypothetical protein
MTERHFMTIDKYRPGNVTSYTVFIVDQILVHLLASIISIPL